MAEEAEPKPKEESGIGLKNVKEMLGLIYGGEADLAICKEPDRYVVSLTIPVNDTENADNRR